SVAALCSGLGQNGSPASVAPNSGSGGEAPVGSLAQQGVRERVLPILGPVVQQSLLQGTVDGGLHACLGGIERQGQQPMLEVALAQCGELDQPPRVLVEPPDPREQRVLEQRRTRVVGAGGDQLLGQEWAPVCCSPDSIHVVRRHCLIADGNDEL